MPLFNSYLFVKATPLELAKAMQVNGVLTYVSHCGKPATINESEIERIRTIVKNYSDIETVSLRDVKVGDNVKVNLGPLSDQEGEIQQINGKTVIMVIKNLNCALTVKINRKDILQSL